MRQGAPLTYFYDGILKDIFGSEILAKRDFFGIHERRRAIFGSRRKNTGISLAIVFLICSNQQEHKRNLLLVWYFFGIYKK